MVKIQAIHVPQRRVLATLLIVNMLMASRVSLSRSLHPLLKNHSPKRIYQFTPKQFQKSHLCPLWSSSFSFCLQLQSLHKSKITSVPFASYSCPSSSSLSATASASMASVETNPLLQDFEFPPFDAVEAKHVTPGVRALLKQMVTLSLYYLRISSFLDFTPLDFILVSICICCYTLPLGI